MKCAYWLRPQQWQESRIATTRRRMFAFVANVCGVIAICGSAFAAPKAGKACYMTISDARPAKTNPNLFNHIVIIRNQCFKPIKLKICYHKTRHCIDMLVPPRTTREGWLGALPAMPKFAYDVQEIN